MTSREDMQIFVENIEDDIFISYYLSFFCGRFPYLKLISYILLSYSVFVISMLILRDFHAINTVMFLLFYYK